jgi:heme/copper-type cytochrome/quinol oxidase subunit 3
MSERRREIDVSGLPSVVFGSKSLLWWGTLGFAVIEGFSLAITVATYLYLRQSSPDWPPGRTLNPSLLEPTINTLLILLLIWPMQRAAKAAKAFDHDGVTRWLVVGTLLQATAVVLRWFDLLSLNVRWDAHAYGSAAWMVVVSHATLLLVEFVETGTIAAVFLTGRSEEKHYPDVTDASDYQYFLSLAWVPLYLIIYWGPRVL